jgi:hypothetical protein
MEEARRPPRGSAHSIRHEKAAPAPGAALAGGHPGRGRPPLRPRSASSSRVRGRTGEDARWDRGKVSSGLPALPAPVPVLGKRTHQAVPLWRGGGLLAWLTCRAGLRPCLGGG